MAKVLERKERRSPAIILDIDEYETLLEQADPEFQKSLIEAWEDYKAGRIKDKQALYRSL